MDVPHKRCMQRAMLQLVILGSNVPRFYFFLAAAAGHDGLVGGGSGGPPTVDAHEERALLDLCNANGLRPFTPYLSIYYGV